MTLTGCPTDNGTTDPCASGHSWGAWTQTTAPTCTTAGIKTQTCTVSGCGSVNPATQAGDALLGHQVPGAEAATCTTPGNTGTGNCTRPGCGVSVIGDPINPLGHDCTVFVSTTATCTEAGQNNNKCSRCTATEQSPQTALGHNFVNGECTRCDAVNITLSNKTPGVAGINTVSIIDKWNSAGVGVNDGMNNLMAEDAMGEDLFPALSAQAARLQEFFAGSTGDTRFAAAATAQNSIRQINGKTAAQYIGVVNAQTAALMQFLPAATGDGDFAVLWNGYKAGHYVLTRDWQTINEGAWVTGQDEGRIEIFQSAYQNATGNTLSGNWASIRPNTIIPGMGYGTAPANGLKAIEDKMVTLAKAALVAQHFPDNDQTAAMARALIIQLGQDNVEFEAFYDDLQAAGLTTALEYAYDRPDEAADI